MSAPLHEQGHPGEKVAHSKSWLAGEDKASLPTSDAQWEGLAAYLDGAFAVMVETAHGRYRRRLWFSLSSAERAAEKARDAGHTATVVLVELTPVHRVGSDL